MKTEFEVVEKWANADSVKEKVIRDGFDNEQEANAYAAELNGSRAFPWSAFVIRQKQAGCADTTVLWGVVLISIVAGWIA